MFQNQPSGAIFQNLPPDAIFCDYASDVYHEWHSVAVNSSRSYLADGMILAMYTTTMPHFLIISCSLQKHFYIQDMKISCPGCRNGKHHLMMFPIPHISPYKKITPIPTYDRKFSTSTKNLFKLPMIHINFTDWSHIYLYMLQTIFSHHFCIW